MTCIFRPILVLAIIMCLPGCGKPTDSASSAGTSPTTTRTVMIGDENLMPDDIGATAMHAAFDVPANQELQVAAVIDRDGAFSADESFIHSVASNHAERRSCSIVALAPHGPLRPDAVDTMVIIEGHRYSVTHASGQAIHGLESHVLLDVGGDFQPIGDLVYSAEGATSYSNNVLTPANVAFGVHLYARLVPIDAQHPVYHELQQSHGNSTIGRELPLRSLTEVVPEAGHPK